MASTAAFPPEIQSEDPRTVPGAECLYRRVVRSPRSVYWLIIVRVDLDQGWWISDPTHHLQAREQERRMIEYVIEPPEWMEKCFPIEG